MCGEGSHVLGMGWGQQHHEAAALASDGVFVIKDSACTDPFSSSSSNCTK